LYVSNALQRRSRIGGPDQLANQGKAQRPQYGIADVGNNAVVV
jgi:hypothetical protein